MTIDDSISRALSMRTLNSPHATAVMPAVFVRLFLILALSIPATSRAIDLGLPGLYVGMSEAEAADQLRVLGISDKLTDPATGLTILVTPTFREDRIVGLTSVSFLLYQSGKVSEQDIDRQHRVWLGRLNQAGPTTNPNAQDTVLCAIRAIEVRLQRPPGSALVGLVYRRSPWCEGPLSTDANRAVIAYGLKPTPAAQAQARAKEKAEAVLAALPAKTASGKDCVFKDYSTETVRIDNPRCNMYSIPMPERCVGAGTQEVEQSVTWLVNDCDRPILVNIPCEGTRQLQVTVEAKEVIRQDFTDSWGREACRVGSQRFLK